MNLRVIHKSNRWLENINVGICFDELSQKVLTCSGQKAELEVWSPDLIYEGTHDSKVMDITHPLASVDKGILMSGWNKRLGSAQVSLINRNNNLETYLEPDHKGYIRGIYPVSDGSAYIIMDSFNHVNSLYLCTKEGKTELLWEGNPKEIVITAAGNNDELYFVIHSGHLEGIGDHVLYKIEDPNNPHKQEKMFEFLKGERVTKMAVHPKNNVLLFTSSETTIYGYDQDGSKLTEQRIEGGFYPDMVFSNSGVLYFAADGSCIQALQLKESESNVRPAKLQHV